MKGIDVNPKLTFIEIEHSLNMNNTSYKRPIWEQQLKGEIAIQIIDQRLLPHRLAVIDLKHLADCADAISDMWVRGAPLIGVTAAYGMYFSAKNIPSNSEADIIDDALDQAAQQLLATRPTAINLHWAVKRMQAKMEEADTLEDKQTMALHEARAIAEEDVSTCYNIGLNGLQLIEQIANQKHPDEPVNILTHCNAGWLACVEWGTATSPIYQAHEKGINLHVWVDETRPRNQGANLTSWEFGQQGVPHTVIIDNSGGSLMQRGMVDLMITGTDRTTYTGDVANKIGTYLKALAAYDNDVPYYVALPSSTIDWDISDGIQEIPIEERNENEVHYISGKIDKKLDKVRITPENSRAYNVGFDVTPARFVTGLVTEKGVCEASEEGIRELFPEKVVNKNFSR